MLNRYMKVYVLADSWRLGWLKREIRRVLVLYHQKSYVVPSDLQVLYHADLERSLLYRFLMAQLAFDIHFDSIPEIEVKIADFEKLCKRMPQAMIWDLLTSIGQNGDTNSSKPSQDPSRQSEWLTDEMDE